ncbi:MAG: DNA polymerase III subunit beta [Bdellovibrionaceae bacterium]|nr:DNA polymerase III subunit beta [Pseudobdellovibrionaceae bacterium]MDW8189344.1 DNA polymerase III subunit beta [Pseudobdellovibrionaceae bacterium]
MFIRLEQKPLLQILAQAQTVVERKTTSQQLTNVYLKASGQSLSVYATDLEVSLVGEINCEIIQEGVATVGAKTLFEVIRELKPHSLRLSTQQNHWLDIQQDKFHSKIIGIPPEEYPVFILNLPNEWVQIPSVALKTLIGKTDYAMATDSARSHLMGEYFVHRDGYLQMASTDSHRLAVAFWEYQGKIPLPIKNGIIIPKKGILEIKKLLDDSDANDHLDIASDGTQIFVRKPGITLGIRLLDGNFPNYRSLEIKHKSFAVMDKNEVIGAIKRVSLFSSHKSKAINCRFDAGVLSIQTNSLEFGDAVDEIPIELKGPPQTITFNPKYILDCLSTISEEKVEMHLSGAESASEIKGHGSKSDIHIVMPMKV